MGGFTLLSSRITIHTNMNIDLNEDIQKQIEMFDGILAEFNQSGIFNNPDFRIDREKWWLEFSLCRKNSVDLRIDFSGSEMWINIDRTNETYGYGNEDTETKNYGFKAMMRIILSSTIKIEYWGKNLTKIYFLNEHGEQVGSMKYYTSLFTWFPKLTETKVYPPIYKLN